MTPLEHAVLSFLPRGRAIDVVVGLAPDIANLALVGRSNWIPEAHPVVRASRILHSPLTVAVLMVWTRGRAWPYMLHWLCDVATHADRRQWSWPFVR